MVVTQERLDILTRARAVWSEKSKLVRELKQHIPKKPRGRPRVRPLKVDLIDRFILKNADRFDFKDDDADEVVGDVVDEVVGEVVDVDEVVDDDVVDEVADDVVDVDEVVDDGDIIIEEEVIIKKVKRPKTKIIRKIVKEEYESDDDDDGNIVDIPNIVYPNANGMKQHVNKYDIVSQYGMNNINRQFQQYQPIQQQPPQNPFYPEIVNVNPVQTSFNLFNY